MPPLFGSSGGDCPFAPPYGAPPDIYIYIFHPRYLHNDIFRYVTLRYPMISHGSYLMAVLMAVLHKLITRVIIATGLAWPGLQVFWVFAATFTLVEPTTQPG